MKGGFDLLDLNAGCPARKVVKGGKGSALLRHPEEVARIIRMLVSEVPCPVTLKIRSGWDPSNRNYIEVAEAARDAGASAICLHPRTTCQLYRGRSRVDDIRELKRSLDIPVFASGDLFSASDVARVKEESGCDGVFIARGALGSPWIFEHLESFDPMVACEDKDFEQLKAVMLKHIMLNVSYYGEKQGLRRMYKHICWYLKRYKGLDSVMKEFRKEPGIDGTRRFMERLGLEKGRYLSLKASNRRIL
jgi:nifR3 family TIM-barrel protein